MEFRSHENKEMLYQILSSHPLRAMNNARFSKALDAQVNLVYKERFKYKNTLVEMNKEIIRRFQIIAQDIQQQQRQEQQQQQRQQPKQMQRQQGTDNSYRTNALKPKSEYFEKRVKERQDSFVKLVNPPKPKEIDFSDEIQDGAMPSMDTTLIEREKELREAMKNYNSDKASEWIGNEAVKKNIKIDTNSNISLEHDTIKTTKTKKKVKFKVSEMQSSKPRTVNPTADTSSFLNKLKKVKKTENVNIDVKKEIQDMINMHHNIINRLENVLRSL